MSSLELHDVSKTYGDGPNQVQALSGINLSVEPGSLVAVMGASGSGKSTLLSIAGSLEEPSAGEIRIDGRPLSAMSRSDKARLRRRTIGYVFQDYNLLAGLTAAENVALPLELDGVSVRKARVAALAALDELGLGGRAPHFPDELSGGERQRVAIARAVVGDRHLVLADEPSGALDSANGEAVMRLLSAACHRGVAAVVVTHDERLASWADRIVVLRDGRVLEGVEDSPRPNALVSGRVGRFGTMTPTLATRTPRVDSGGGGAPARRAMLRWAWRLFRREWRQQLSVLLLIIVAMAGTVIGAGIAVNTPVPSNAGFGTAEHLVTIPASDAHIASDLALLRTHFGTIDVIENEAISTGLVGGTELRAQDPRGPYGRPMLSLVSGGYPAGSGEVAMTAALASTFDLRLGGVWHESGRSLHLVGIVENPENFLDAFALVPPGELGTPSSVTVLFDGSAASLASFRFPPGSTPVSPTASNGIPPSIIVLVVATLALVFIGLVSAGSFTVLAQRRRRSLGMLSSLGATDRNVRLVMVANGAVVGILGALVGAVLGFAAWIAYAPHLATSAQHQVLWSNEPWWLIATALMVAVVTAIVAARRPAASLAQMSVIEALSGRPSPAKSVHRSAYPGVAALGVGLVLLAMAGGAHGGDSIELPVGILATAVGLLLLAPLTLNALSVNASRAPVAARIAMRDLSRYRARSASALAATSLAVLIAMMIAVVATGRYADVLDYFGPNLPSNQLVVYAPGSSPGNVSGIAVTAAKLAAFDARVAIVAASVGTRDVLLLDGTADAALVQTGPHGASNSGSMYVATPALLRHYGIDPSEIRPTTLLVTSRPGLEELSGLQLLHGDLQSPTANILALDGPSVQTFSQLPTDTSDPNLLVTMHAVQKFHLPVIPTGWLIQSSRPLTNLQTNTARQVAAGAGMSIEVKNNDPSLDQLRNYATFAGILVALGVLAMTVGLIRSESAGDLRTLTAAGANRRTRRTLTAATAGALGLLGALTGTLVAYLDAAAYFGAQLSSRLNHVPTFDLLVVLVAMPLAAAAGGWLLAGREPPAIARQPIE